MWWMWFVGPALTLFIFALAMGRDKKQAAAVERWRTNFGRKPELGEAAGYREPQKRNGKPQKGPRKVNSIPGPLARLVDSAGGGTVVAHHELVPKIAYLSAMAADAINASDHYTVTGKLEEAGPSFTARPLPIVDGRLVDNTGVEFKKDTEFMELYLVDRFVEGEGKATNPGDPADKAIRKWLSPPIRAALIEMPSLWLRVSGKVMSVSVYGPADAEKLRDLVAAADVIFAEYGADGGPSLVGDDEDEEPAGPTGETAEAT